jgi:replicative DNA helicase
MRPRDRSELREEQLSRARIAFVPPARDRTNGHRAPPHNVQAEAALLGAALLSTNAIRDAIEIVGPLDFYKSANAHIFDAMLSLHSSGDHVDQITVGDELQRAGLLDDAGGRGYLLDLVATAPSTAGAPKYARIVHECAMLRQLQGLAREIIDGAHRRDHSATLVGRLQEAVVEFQRSTDRAKQDRAVGGGSFVLDGAAKLSARWGRGDLVAWQRGESLMVCGPTGVGKTTLTIQIVGALVGVEPPELLTLPVERARRVLYLAMDRPAQIARAMARRWRDEHRDVLDDRLVVWRGPLPSDLGRNPDVLIDLVRRVGADVVVIDSLKDAAVRLSDDEVGGNVNRAIQTCLAESVDVLALHHQRKGQGGEKPKALEDVYGSTWITAGAGSVLLLWGSPGDPIVDMRHLKPPAGELGPWRLEHGATDTTLGVQRPADGAHGGGPRRPAAAGRAPPPGPVAPPRRMRTPARPRRRPHRGTILPTPRRTARRGPRAPEWRRPRRCALHRRGAACATRISSPNAPQPVSDAPRNAAVAA